MRCIVPYCLPSQATTCKGTLNVAKMPYKLRVASGLYLPWYGSMEWNMVEIFSMEKKKIARMEYEKISSVPFHTMLWQERHSFFFFYI